MSVTEAGTTVARRSAPADADRSGGPSPVETATFVACAALLSVVLPALVVQLVPDTGRSEGWVPALGLAVWCGLRMALLIAVAEARFFAFFFWLFTYIFMGLAPAVQIRSDQPSFTTPDVLPSQDVTIVWVVALGVVAFEVGGLAARRRRTAARRPLPGSGSGIRPLVAVLLTLSGLAVSAYYLSRIGPGPLLTSREAANVARAAIWPTLSTRAVVLSSAIYLTLLGMASLLQVWRFTADVVARLGLGALVAACLADLALIVNPLSTARFSLGTVLFALVIMFGAAANRARIRLTLLALVFGLFFLFPLGNAFRTTERSFARTGFFEEYQGSADYDAFWQVGNALGAWYDGSPLPVGRQALGSLLFWLPRTVWPDKPVDTGILLANYRGYAFTNLSAPTWAEALVNGGLVAVVLTFLALGFLVRRIDDKVSVSLQTGGVWAVLGAVLPAYFVILLRGSLLQATGAAAIMILGLVLLRRPRPLAPP